MRLRRAHGMSVMLIGCVVLGGCSAGGGAEGGSRTVPPWDTEAAPSDVSAQLEVKVPQGAGDLRAARRDGLQDDLLLLAFTLPEAQVDAFVTSLRPDRPLEQRDEPLSSPAEPRSPFAELGLPDPETLADVREGEICAPCGDEIIWLSLAVHPLGEGTAQVYLQGVD